MSAPEASASELLHSLGYLYMRSGEDSRSLAFLLLAHKMRPDDPGILRTLAAAFVAGGAGERGLGVLSRLEGIEGGPSIASTLLRAKALWAMDERVEARIHFRRYVTMRRSRS